MSQGDRGPRHGGCPGRKSGPCGHPHPLLLGVSTAVSPLSLRTPQHRVDIRDILLSPEQRHPKKPRSRCTGTSLPAPSLHCTLPVSPQPQQAHQECKPEWCCATCAHTPAPTVCTLGLVQPSWEVSIQRPFLLPIYEPHRPCDPPYLCTTRVSPVPSGSKWMGLRGCSLQPI